MSFLNERGKEVGTHNVQRVGKWVGVDPNTWFLADEVVAVQAAPARHETTWSGRMGSRIVLRNGDALLSNDDAEAVWKAVAGPATDNATSLGATLGKPQEQTAKGSDSA